MAFGFKSINDFGQVIISDELQTLHFAGKAPRDTGVDIKVLSSFPSYGGPNNTTFIDKRVIITYKITTPGTPLVFIKPASTIEAYKRWASIITQEVSGTTWTFQVMMSGDSTSDIPELYCFVDANSVEITTESGDHGMIVYKSDGSKTYDSRVQPLAVIDGGTSQPRTLPANDGNPRTTTRHPWNFATLDFDFRSNSASTTTSNSITNVDHTTLMYAAPSLAQAVYKRQAGGFKRSCKRFLWFRRCQDHLSTASWWVMYRSAFRLQAGQFQSGWGTFAAGFSFSSKFESGGFLGGGGGSSGFGTQPYVAKTINLTSNAFIIADSTGYQ